MIPTATPHNEEASDPSRRVESRLACRVSSGAMPGASWCVEREGKPVASGAVGMQSLVPDREPASPATLYDLASLTKVLVTAPLALLLARRGGLDLRAPLTELFPEFRGGLRAAATLEDCLDHSAGFPAWRPLPVLLRHPADLLSWLGALPEGSGPCVSTEYSDLGYILAGLAIERAAGLSLDAAFGREIAGPLGISDLLFRPAPDFLARTAPTEAAGNAYERKLAEGQLGAEAGGRYRAGPLRGEVNDGNTHFLGGVSGAAGLFGTATAVARLAREFLGGDAADCSRSGARGLFRPPERTLLRTERPNRTGSGRGLGFELATAAGASAGPALSSRAFGHTGFTGTSLWLDPEDDSIFVLLTNRIHPAVPEAPFHPVRREFHEAART